MPKRKVALNTPLICALLFNVTFWVLLYITLFTDMINIIAHMIATP